MPTLEPLPERLKEYVSSSDTGDDGDSDSDSDSDSDGDNDNVRLSVSVDLLPDGSFGKQWLVVTKEKVLVFDDDSAGEAPANPRIELLLSDISAVKAESLIGGGALEVSCNGKRIELVRYTNAHSKRFGFVAKALEKWSKGEEAEPEGEEEERKCPKCGLPLEQGTKVCPACVPKSKTLLRLIAYLKPHWKLAALLSTLTLFSTGLGLVPPYLNKPLMDIVLAPKGEPLPTEKRLSLLALLMLAMVLARVLISLLNMSQGWLSAALGNRLTHHVRCQLYEHLQYLSLRFFDKQQVGNIISRVNQDTGQLQSFLVWGAQDLANNVLLVIGIGVMLFVLNWKLALIVLVPAPFVGTLSVRFWRRIRIFMHRFFQRWSNLNTVLSESLSGLKVIKAFAQEPKEIERFRMRSDELAIVGVQAERVWAVLFSAMSLLIMLGTMLVWYVGGRDVIWEKMSLGEFTAFFFYVSMFYGPVQAMSWLINWCSRSLTAAERVFEILDSQPDVKEAEDAVPIPKIQGHVEFKNVTFGYDKHKPVLKDINLSVKAGEMIGLVGHSGAGKTTTINLLCRFYDVDEGQILIDGVNIRKIKQEDLRRQMGIVPQDTFLFSGTIFENIAYAKPGATQEEVIQAAKIANAHGFIIQKPDGYDTYVGERGQSLSAGERQRIAIARAILHDPRVLILDEATSQVDVETEKQIQEAIARLVKGRTTFAIAHRLSTLKNADRLVVLKDGKVEEVGTHDELLKKQGEFHRLVQMYQEVSKVRAVHR